VLGRPADRWHSPVHEPRAQNSSTETSSHTARETCGRYGESCREGIPTSASRLQREWTAASAARSKPISITMSRRVCRPQYLRVGPSGNARQTRASTTGLRGWASAPQRVRVSGPPSGFLAARMTLGLSRRWRFSHNGRVFGMQQRRRRQLRREPRDRRREASAHCLRSRPSRRRRTVPRLRRGARRIPPSWV
jgi:hypothetical protein